MYDLSNIYVNEKIYGTKLLVSLAVQLWRHLKRTSFEEVPVGKFLWRSTGGVGRKIPMERMLWISYCREVPVEKSLLRSTCGEAPVENFL